MLEQNSWMAREIAAVPDVLLRQEAAVERPVRELVGRLLRSPPQLVVTCARGSSAHAATFCKHLIEHQLGIPVCAAAPSIASIYGRELGLRGQLVLVISQSGTSDDLIAFARYARNAGGLTVAVTNSECSPLTTTCEYTLPIGAGPEVSVAATKTFVATVCLLLRMVAAWAGNDEQVTLRALPKHLSEAMTMNWESAVEALSETRSLATIGRGPTLAIAREAALKLKETCNLHAEAFSGAEFMHGPVTLASQRYPVVMFMPSDAALAGMRHVAATLLKKGCRVFLAGHGNGNPGPYISLPGRTTQSAAVDAICLIQSFYCMLVRLAARRGCDVDNPPTLKRSRGRHDGGRAKAVVASTLFDGTQERQEWAVIIERSRIAWVGPRAHLPEGLPCQCLPPATWLAPGFIDLQVNGGGDALFNADPTSKTIKHIAAAHRRFGTTSLLPTLITDTPAKMHAALQAVQETSTEDGILGVHFEGPFLSTEKAGVHDPSLIRAASAMDLEFLCSLTGRSVLVTLAPERLPERFVSSLAARGVRVALGHPMASYPRPSVPSPLV